MKVVILCIIFFFQSSLEAPVDPVKIEHEILDKIGKHGTVINIFEAHHDDIQRIKRDLTANAGIQLLNFENENVGVEIPLNFESKISEEFNFHNRSIGTDRVKRETTTLLNTGNAQIQATSFGDHKPDKAPDAVRIDAQIQDSDREKSPIWTGNYHQDFNSGNFRVGVGIRIPF
uniref:Uncharacterized protein n=1 Tax=Panagrolaimus davidi TaxID=227884 RepID=A0A914QK93_9BILA